jgi:hypothetical protein
VRKRVIWMKIKFFIAFPLLFVCEMSWGEGWCDKRWKCEYFEMATGLRNLFFIFEEGNCWMEFFCWIHSLICMSFNGILVCIVFWYKGESAIRISRVRHLVWSNGLVSNQHSIVYTSGRAWVQFPQMKDSLIHII